MRLSRLIIYIGVITLFALLYVHQQVELVKISYSIEYKEGELKDMLDREDGLRYNINNLENPSRLESALLAKKIEMTFPKKRDVIKVPSMAIEMSKGANAVGLEKKAGILGIFDFLSPRAEAQVKENKI